MSLLRNKNTKSVFFASLSNISSDETDESNTEEIESVRDRSQNECLSSVDKKNNKRKVGKSKIRANKTNTRVPTPWVKEVIKASDSSTAISTEYSGSSGRSERIKVKRTQGGHRNGRSASSGNPQSRAGYQGASRSSPSTNRGSAKDHGGSSLSSDGSPKPRKKRHRSRISGRKKTESGDSESSRPPTPNLEVIGRRYGTPTHVVPTPSRRQEETEHRPPFHSSPLDRPMNPLCTRRSELIGDSPRRITDGLKLPLMPGPKISSKPPGDRRKRTRRTLNDGRSRVEEESPLDSSILTTPSPSPSPKSVLQRYKDMKKQLYSIL